MLCALSETQIAFIVDSNRVGAYPLNPLNPQPLKKVGR